MSKKVILTGLRANNDLHIGNYFGALLPIIDMAKNRSDEYQVNLFVPDLHSFTTPIDHTQLQKQIMHNLKLYVAAGLPLDNPNVHIYRQSYVPAHSELTIILNSFTGMGQMSRMTQYKEKSGIKSELERTKILDRVYKEYGKNTIDDLATKALEGNADFENFLLDITKKIQRGIVAEESSDSSVGLFDYPVLMAADILLYGTSYVPVGDDQTQHLEFARDIAERMNSRFGELFTVPEPVKKQHEFFGNDQGLRIKDLQDPTKKMSKSDESGKGIVFLGDEPSAAAAKIMSAATDSLGSIKLDYDNQPGVSNLLQILALLQGRTVQEVASEHAGRERYGDFKKEVAEAMQTFLSDFQTRLATVDEHMLQTKLEASEKQMNVVANEALYRVQKAVGLR